MQIAAVDPNSPLFGYVRPGYSVVSINGDKVLDEIDFRYKVTDESIDIRFSDARGKEFNFKFDEYYPGDLGLTFVSDKIRTCKNDCIFCFIVQQPQGLRRSLYTKDEDYRLSFTHGNFITLSNTTDEDLDRIISQRLSPLYVSVHATDDKLRRCMLRNEKLSPIIPRLKYLGENGITIHSQVVLCPKINDGDQLARTVDELVGLYPMVETLAVVPVGLTKYREKLAKLRPYRREEAGDIIYYINSRQEKFRKSIGTRFVWPSDEFYVIAGQEFPRLSFYEEMNQFENGIGMAREFLTKFKRNRNRLKGIKSDKRALFVTGTSAQPFLTKEILPFLTEILGLKVEIDVVPNQFWGETVTISGLLTGQDILRHARKNFERFDALVLPPNCLNNDSLFLDNLSLEQFRTALGKPVFVGQYNLAATIKDIFQ
jgi:putative radical SAM enzyme (TIGR03279 family)